MLEPQEEEDDANDASSSSSERDDDDDDEGTADAGTDDATVSRVRKTSSSKRAKSSKADVPLIVVTVVVFLDCGGVSNSSMEQFPLTLLFAPLAAAVVPV